MADRVKNEIHCRLEPAMMQYIVNQSIVRNCTVSDICRSLISEGSRSNEVLTRWRAIALQSTDCHLKMLNLLQVRLAGFEFDRGADCEGENQSFSWSFGLDASDEYFGTAEDCLLSFLLYLNSLSFHYKQVEKEYEAPKRTDIEEIGGTHEITVAGDGEVEDEDSFDW